MSILKSISNWLSGKRTVKRRIKQYRRSGKTVKGHTRTMTIEDKLRSEWRRELKNNPEGYEKIGDKYRMAIEWQTGVHDDPRISSREIEQRLSNAFLKKKMRRYR